MALLLPAIMLVTQPERVFSGILTAARLAVSSSGIPSHDFVAFTSYCCQLVLHVNQHADAHGKKKKGWDAQLHAGEQTAAAACTRCQIPNLLPPSPGSSSESGAFSCHHCRHVCALFTPAAQRQYRRPQRAELNKASKMQLNPFCATGNL